MSRNIQKSLNRD